MVGFSRITLIGNVGSDPEMRYTPNGQAVTDFRMAVTRRYTGSDGNHQEETQWFRVTSWGRQAETVNQYLTKGQRVFVEGRLNSSAFIGRDGEARASLDVTADTVRFLDRRADVEAMQQSRGVQDAPPNQVEKQGAADVDDVEELPW